MIGVTVFSSPKMAVMSTNEMHSYITRDAVVSGPLVEKRWTLSGVRYPLYGINISASPLA